MGGTPARSTVLRARGLNRENVLTGKAKASHGLTKGQIIVATIESLAPGGEGVTRERGLPIFVNRVCPGDRLELELFDVRKDFARARALRILESSPQRAEPPCKLFKVCGGCQWQHIDYAWQLKAKENIVRQTVKHIGGLDPDLARPTIGAVEPLFYRNKVQFPVESPAGSARIRAGYYKQDTHDLVNIKHCPVQPEPLDRMLETVKAVCERHRITAYDERKRTGLLRHITARYSFDRQSALLTLVLNAHPDDQERRRRGQRLDLSMMQEVARQIMSEVSEITGVCLNFNRHAGNRIMGETTVPLVGEPYLIERLRTNRSDLPERLQQGLEFKLSPTSFFQVNSAQTVRLLEEIVDAVLFQERQSTALPLLARAPVVVDAYAGVGAIALWLAPIASRVIALEEHPAAVADGLLNLVLNKIENVEFREGQVEEIFPQLQKEGLKPDVLVLDPPRKGLSARAIENIVHLAPPRLIYVSCNPATLARDLKILERNGYKTKRIQPIDMFPQTYHVESVTLLERQIPETTE